MTTQPSSSVYIRTVMRLALLLIIGGVLCPVFMFNTPSAEAAEETLYIKVLVARVRQDPTTESPILFRARRGDPVVVEQKQGEWYRIKHPTGQSGWVHRTLLIDAGQNSGTPGGQDYFLKSVRLEVLSGTEEAVTFQLDGFHPPETFILKGEQPRVVCDFLNTRALESVGNRVDTGGTLIQDIRIAPYGGGAPRVRAVLDLAPGRSYQVDQTFYKEENRYIVTVAATAP